MESKIVGDHEPTLSEMREVKWTKKGAFRGSSNFPETLPRSTPNFEDRSFQINLTGNCLAYENGSWNNVTPSPDSEVVSTDPLISENICLKKRVETLIRAAAISEIEVQQLKEQIREAKQILAQLAQII